MIHIRKISSFIRKILLFGMLIFLMHTAIAQNKILETASKSTTYVDAQGILRWQKDKSQVALFGVNYTTPFAHPYRMHKYLNVPLEKAIDEDVYHFARLGFDAFRVHVWDCEISDTLGNLLENDHLRMFDYLLAKLKERGIKILITPIAYWGDGYPEPDEKTPGFSTKYGKANCLTNPEAIKAQENYLFQFVNHVNKYTGLAYKNDPDIIAFEVCNEPHHGGTAKETTSFINHMVASIRKSGCSKPVFYNISHSIQLADAYFSANIQGGTFQWYPSGLVRGHEIHGNFLPNVTEYPIPFADDPKFKKMTKIVYEFDAADIGRSYMYPFMAKSFRQSGIQFATQFAYDPIHMAPFNTDYQTHYMNLAYAPQKALSLKIAGEVFHKLPLNQTIGTYPSDTVFDVFRVSYKTDLAEMASDEKFMYTNTTTTLPLHPEKLLHIAGYANSPVISYDGCGAYFLDRIEEGVWRLEVMPDAIWVHDPFEKASPKKQVSVILWNPHPMSIKLPDLGTNFSIMGLNDGNTSKNTANVTQFTITPGTYLLTRNGINTALKGNDTWKNITLKEFVAPPANCKSTYVLHQPAEELTTGKNYIIDAKVISANKSEKVELYFYGRRWRPEIIEMTKTSSYMYTAEINSDLIREGFLRYYITVSIDGKSTTFPSGNEGTPADWDFYDQNPYQTRVVSPSTPICLFDALTDGNFVYGNSWFPVMPSKEAGENVLNMNVRNLKRDEHTYAARFFFADKIKGRASDLDSFNALILHGYSTTHEPINIQISLVDDLGYTFGTMLRIDTLPGDYKVRLADLREIQSINLPNSYPTFLPFYFDNNYNESFNIHKSESVQFSIGPGIPESEYDKAVGVAIGKVFMQ